MNKILLRLIHTFTKHNYEPIGFHNLCGGKHDIVMCDCGKEKYTTDGYTERKRRP